MTPIQQLFLGTGSAVATKTYIDDSFSTYLWEGTGSTININNGINLSGDGGMVWVTNRDGIYQNLEMDTELGVNKQSPLQGSGGTQSAGGRITAFNNNGFTMGSDVSTNNSGQSIVSTTFKNTTGFFKIIKYTGNGTAGRQLSHDLGCVPGIICIRKNTTSNGEYNYMYHRYVDDGLYPEKYNTYLQLTGYTYTLDWLNNTAPTASVVTLGGGGESNQNGAEYIMWLWAGGESAAATARSVAFDGSGDFLTTNASSDYTIGTNDFTIELWCKKDNSSGTFLFDYVDGSNYGRLTVFYNAAGKMNLKTADGGSTGANRIESAGSFPSHQWHHVAVTRQSGLLKLFVNGVLQGTYNDSSTNYTWNQLKIGSSSVLPITGKISNFRLVVGTAVYTSSFRPPTEPLTNITNTKLLCCNNSSVTGTTTGTVTSSGDPTARTDSPFDDPNSFVFGENEDQPAVKVGAYKGNASSTGPEIFLGFEPQMILLGSNTNGATNSGWRLFDSMRGIVTGGNDATINLSSSSVESSSEKIELTPTGFKIVSSDNDVNEDGENYLFLAIRRSDGYVGKPRTATELFAMDYGSGSTTIPEFDSGFPVDFATYRVPTSATAWLTGARLTGAKYMRLNTTDAEGNDGDTVWDSNVGWQKAQATNRLSWMWSRRGQGFDVVNFKGNGVGNTQIPHSLNKTVEMMWVKNRDSSQNWAVYHKGLNGGTNPQDYFIYLNLNTVNGSGWEMWYDTAPTATHFTLGTWDNINEDDSNHIAMLFASVDGISKVGYYSGSGSSGNAQNIGFQPRFLIIRHTNGQDPWMVFDTTRGINNSGDDKLLYLNSNDSESSIGDHDWISISSTGFSLSDGNGATNTSGGKYIYYAHA